MAEDDTREGYETAITSYGIPLALVTSFKYLGIVLYVADNNCPAVVSNRRK